MSRPGSPERSDVWPSVGRILGAFGVQGELKIESWSDPDVSVLASARQWRVDVPEGVTFAADKRRLLAALPFRLPAVLDVRTVRRQGAVFVARLAEALTREGAEAMKGLEISVARDAFPPAQDDEYYPVDLIGCAAVNRSGQRLGEVVEVDDHGVQDLLRLDNGILIPFVPAHVLEVRLAERQILVDWESDWL